MDDKADNQPAPGGHYGRGGGGRRLPPATSPEPESQPDPELVSGTIIANKDVNGRYGIVLTDGRQVRAHRSGTHVRKLDQWDRVLVEISPYDPRVGRVLKRLD